VAPAILSPHVTPPRKRQVTLAVLCVTLLLVSLDNTILNVALPTIVRTLHATSSELQWIVAAYSVTLAGLLLSIGALGDRVGRKWVFLAGLALFGAGSAAAAWATTPDLLTVARVGMGVGAAALMPSTLSILINVFPGEGERAKAIGIWSGTAGIGVAIGPILGGLLLAHFWWGSVFLVNVPICILGVIATIAFIPNSRNTQTKRADPVGALLSISGFGLLLWGIIEAPNLTWTSPSILAALIGGIFLIGSFAAWERRMADPMLPLRFFRNPRFSAAIASLAMVLFALIGMFFLLTQYFQFSLGYSALQTGLRIGPIAAVILVAAPTSILVVRRFGNRTVIVAGLVLVAVGLGLLSRTSLSSTYLQILPSLLLLGIGSGVAMAPSTESIMGSLPPDDAGVGSATSDTAMQMGGALGVGILGTVLNLRYKEHVTSLIAGHGVPASVARVVTGSLGGALVVAQRVPGHSGTTLARGAKSAFISGMDLSLVIGAAVVAIACIVVLVLLPNRSAGTS
jgi:EmrB/QacA subfamily drug resistance transporter